MAADVVDGAAKYKDVFQFRDYDFIKSDRRRREYFRDAFYDGRDIRDNGK